jgi:hypothetical protein
MVTDSRTRAVACPTCHAGAGARCKIRGIVSDAYHAPRLTLARHENDGPQPGEPVWAIDPDEPRTARKFRVVQVEERSGRQVVDLRLSQGGRRVVQQVYRDDMRYDVVAGLWRVV